MKQEFFDQLDGGWGDLIADTYKKSNETLVEYPLSDPLSGYYYYNDGTENKIIDTIIIKKSSSVEIEIIENPNNFLGKEYALFLKNVSIYNVIYKLRGGHFNKDSETTYVKLKPLEGDDDTRKISFLISITDLKKPGPGKQHIAYYLCMSNDPDFDIKDKRDKSKSGYKPARFNFVPTKWCEKPKFGKTLLGKFKKLGLDVDKDK